MKLTPIASNMTEVEAGDYLILFSHSTPVAARYEGYDAFWYYRTGKDWSSATTRHINKWLNGACAVEKPQEWFDGLKIS